MPDLVKSADASVVNVVWLAQYAAPCPSLDKDTPQAAVRGGRCCPAAVDGRRGGGGDGQPTSADSPTAVFLTKLGTAGRPGAARGRPFPSSSSMYDEYTTHGRPFGAARHTTAAMSTRFRSTKVVNTRGLTTAYVGEILGPKAAQGAGYCRGNCAHAIRRISVPLVPPLQHVYDAPRCAVRRQRAADRPLRRRGELSEPRAASRSCGEAAAGRHAAAGTCCRGAGGAEGGGRG